MMGVLWCLRLDVCMCWRAHLGNHYDVVMIKLVLQIQTEVIDNFYVSGDVPWHDPYILVYLRSYAKVT